jgi:thiamine pyrophosphate-dependent acetolactate synthase large subunit-like protein
MKAYEAIAAQLAHLGAQHIFGLMGDGNLKLIPTLQHELGVHVHSARHEAGAVAMADGFARSSGGVGVCTFTQGPGLTNALTALVTAHRGRVPLLVLAGDTPRSVRGLPQDIEQIPLIEAAGLACTQMRPESAHADVANAWRRALDERRPVLLVMPTDVQDEEAGDSVQPCPPSQRQAVTPGDLSAAAEALSASQRPVLVAGRGALESDARAALLQLGETVGALLATSLPVNGWFSDQEFGVGIAGGFADETTRALINGADCIVAFGASLNHFTSRAGTLFAPDATIVQIDETDAAFGKFTRFDLSVTGDARLVAEQLGEQVSAGTRYRTEAVRETIERGAEAPADASDAAGLDPRAVARALSDLLPERPVLAVDGGHFMGFPSMDIAVDSPRDYVFTLDFGSIGLGLAAAIGAGVANPGRLVVAAVGDGGLMMSLGELDTAARLGLPLLITVFNDQAYGAELHFLRMSGFPEESSQFPTTAPLAPIAQAIGIEALAVTELADLDAVRDRVAKGLTAPLLVDLRITHTVRAAWLEEAFARGTH